MLFCNSKKKDKVFKKYNIFDLFELLINNNEN